jgi:hypothetical protein
MRFRLAAALALWAVFGLSAGAAWAAPAAPRPLITAADLPRGFTPMSAQAMPSATALLDELACEPDTQFSGATTTLRGWSNGRYFLSEMVTRAISDDAAAALQADIFKCVGTLQHVDVPNVPGSVAWTLDKTIGGRHVYEQGTALRRGDVVAALEASALQPSSTALIVHLAAVEAGRMPPGASDPDQRDGAYQSGSISATLLVLLVGYPELMDALGNRRLRRAWRPAAGQPGPSAHPDQVTDVSAPASAMHRRALLTFVLELAVLATIGFGVLFAWAGRVAGPALLASAMVLAVVVFVLRRRTVRIGGLPKMRGASYAAVAVALILGLLGYVLLLLGAWMQAHDPEYALTLGTSGLGVGLAYASLPVLGLAVVSHRYAVRMALSHPPAHRADGAPILYLRSFGDDRLPLRVAPYGRRSFLERLSARRRQSFEEILAEDLQRRAPVAAVGEPGRRMPPIGFVRRSLSDDEWQSHVWQWMNIAHTIVVVVGLGAGLQWEMEALARTGAWRKTLFVFPPMQADELRRRRFRLADLLARSGFRGPGIADPWTPALIVALDSRGVCHYWCARRINAWSYKAALDSAMRFRSQPTVQPPRQTV